jgi:hypothetical protein
MDKDTWIAENLIPKNTEAGIIRKPRLNVKSVDVDTYTRKTKFTICVLGSWAIYMPPYNIARLCSLTREAGYNTSVYDFNVDSHYALKDANPDLADAWNGANYWWWQNPEYYTRIHPTYEPILREYLEVLLATDLDILGFSAYYTNILPTQWMIKEIRKRRPDITIIMGGPECHEHYYKKPDGVDYYFIGESEQNILDFLENWEHGIKPLKPAIGSLYSDTRIDIDSLPYPDYSDFDLTKYWGKNSICAEISRGCIAKCSYCTEVYYWKFRDRGANNVVDELEYQVEKYGINFVSFVDSLMNGNLKEFRNFCEELKRRKLGFTWWGYARADGRMDLDFYQAMADAGCQGFNYGIETGSDKVLKAINKKNTVAEINQNLIDSEKVGMKVSACWVIGAPGEDIEAFTHSFNMLWNHRYRIMAVSPGPGLGDNMGSAYDDREKYNLNPRHTSWLGGWYTLDLTNTKLHRHIRIKLMHMWLYICKEYGGTLTNVHKVGEITDHFSVKFDSEYINDSVEYENFDFNIIKSGHSTFADSVMNEVFGFLRMLWRVRGGYEISIKFNNELDHKDFIFAIVPSTMDYEADIWFKIDDDGKYQVKNHYKFVNKFKDIIGMNGFEYTYEDHGVWSFGTKVKSNKVFYIKTENNFSINKLTLGGCFSSLGIQDRVLLNTIARRLPDNSIVVDTSSGMGGRVSILKDSPSIAEIHAFNDFNHHNIKKEFEYIKSWVERQLIDICLDSNIKGSIGSEYFHTLEKTLEDDPSGILFHQHVTAHSNKVILHDSDTNVWMKPVDLCIISNFDPALIEKQISKWKTMLKQNGYIIAHPYNERDYAEQYDKYKLLLNDGFEFVNSKESIGIFKKI